MRNNPIVFSGRAVKRTKATPDRDSGTTDRDGALTPEVTKQKGYILICDLWQNGMESVHGMWFLNTDAKSHIAKTPEKCLQYAERGKKRMYLEACFQQRRYFYPFVASVNGLLGVEATATLKRLASRLATKWKQPYSKTCGYIKSRIVITLVQSTH